MANGRKRLSGLKVGRNNKLLANNYKSKKEKVKSSSPQMRGGGFPLYCGKEEGFESLSHQN